MRYDYRCPDGHVREVSHGMNDTPEVQCTEPIYVGGTMEPCARPMEKTYGDIGHNPLFVPCKGMRVFNDRLPPLKVDGKPWRP